MSAGPRFDPADFSGDITLDHVVPASEATFAPLPGDLNPELVAALGRRGVERLYSHQAEAYEAVRRGRNLVVVTPTASGKTLCYNLPILQRLLEHPEQRALYLYPTKALAQDQLAELGALKAGLPIEVRVDTYDGDTPPGRRTAIREGGHVVMTNPDMLHTGLLLQPATREQGPGHQAQLDARSPADRGPLDPRRRADHRVLPQPAAGRGDAELPAGRTRAATRRREASARLSRRIPAAAPARDRGRFAQWRYHRGRQHQRARAGHRHREPAVRGVGRLPGDHRVDLAAAGPRGTTVWVGGRVCRVQLASRPVHRPPSRVFPRHRSRGGPHRSRQPALARRAPAGGSVRTSLHGRRAAGIGCHP